MIENVEKFGVQKTTTFGHTSAQVTQILPTKNGAWYRKIVTLPENSPLKKAGIDSFVYSKSKQGTEALQVLSKGKEVASAYLKIAVSKENLRNFFRAIRKYGLHV
jgi:hypothetical protein